MKLLFVVTVLLSVALLPFVDAECPNGCSGSGTCSAKDMCNCFKNYHGNDCSLKTCPFGHGHVNTPQGDLNMDGTIGTATVAVDSLKFPTGSWELYPGDASAQEAHYYQECSARGLCDTETGLCQCFDGYEGSACQRAACPNECSGHGTCESIAEFASDAAGTLFGKDVAVARTYDLWDAKVSYGCRCDPWYFGGDCSKRRCKVGVDPMYEAVGTEILDMFVLRIADTGTPSSTLRLRIFDYWGESYITNKIAFNAADKANTIGNFATAIQALPNDVIKTITCEEYDSFSAFSFVSIFVDATTANTAAGTNYYVVACQFTTNPGKLRLPEIASIDATYASASITGTVLRGEDYDIATLENTNAVTGIVADGNAITIAGNAAPSVPFLAKIKDQYIMINADDAAGGLTADVNWKHTAITASTPLYYAPATFTVGSTTYTTVNLNARTVAAAVGTRDLTLSGTDHALVAGDVVFCENQFFTVTKVSGATVSIDRPFGGLVEAAAIDNGAATASKIYKIIIPTSTMYTYVAECSGRGLCDYETGLCTCCPGFTNDNCDTQNIYAT